MLTLLNPRRGRRAHRRSRRRNSPLAVLFNRRGRRGRRRSRNPLAAMFNRGRRGRKHRRNPELSISSPFQAITSGFNLGTLTKASVVVTGALANTFLTNRIAGLSFVPDFLKSGWGGYVTGLASAGLLGKGVGYIAPSYAGNVFFGGVLEVMTRVVTEQLLPRFGGMLGLGDYLNVSNVANARPLGGLGDYLTPNNVAQARALGYGGMGDYLTPNNVAQARALGYGGMGDYLTPNNVAQARSLGMADYYGQERFISEELAAI